MHNILKLFKPHYTVAFHSLLSQITIHPYRAQLLIRVTEILGSELKYPLRQKYKVFSMPLNAWISAWSNNNYGSKARYEYEEMDR